MLQLHIVHIVHWCQIPSEMLFLVLHCNPFYVAVRVKALLKLLDN